MASSETAAGGHEKGLERWVARLGDSGWVAIGFLLLHMPLAMAMKFVGGVATAHALFVVAFGLWAATIRRSLVLTLFAVAYTVGCEGIWRMVSAGVLWEFGKISTTAIILAAMVRQPRPISTHAWLVYLGMLVPGSLLMLATCDSSRWKDNLSFNMSGPICLAAAGTWLAGMPISIRQLIGMLVPLLAPQVSIATLTFYGVRTMDIEFGEGSSMAASGGYGPNQVAAALALGMVFCFLMLASGRGGMLWKLMLGGLMLWMAAQGLLTLSRSAIYYSVAGILAGLFFLVRDPKKLAVVVLAFGVLGGLGQAVLAPKLDEFTGGALTRRYQRTDLSGRETLIQGDLAVFLNYPLLGVGPGMARYARKEFVNKVGYAHTEFTRLLSEHGMFGLVALGILFASCGKAVLAQLKGWPKAAAASCGTFAFIFMSGSAMRMALPSLLIGLTGALIGREVRSGPSQSVPPPGAMGRVPARFQLQMPERRILLKPRARTTRRKGT